MATTHTPQDFSGRLRRVDAPAFIRQANPLVRILPLILLGYSVLLPAQIQVSLAGQMFDAPRIVCIALLPWMLARIARGALQPTAVDILVLFSGAWMILSFLNWYGAEDGLLRGTALAIDVVLPYLIARLCVQDMNDFRRMLIVMLPGIMAAGIIMAMEALSHQLIIRPVMESIFGRKVINRGGESFGFVTFESNTRLGMLRAFGPFAHPILGGLFMASLLPMYFNSSLRGWPYVLGVMSAFFAIFTVSSAAMLGLVIAIILLSYDALQKRVIPLNWPMLLITLTLLCIAIELVSKDGLMHVIARRTLSPETAFNRIRIWDYGTIAVEKYPWLGRGFTDIERPRAMPPSIDNHWLLLAIRHGMPAAFAALGASILAIAAITRRSLYPSPLDFKLAVGLAITTSVLVINGFTVAFYSSGQCWYWLLIGVVAALGYHLRSASRSAR